MDRIAWIKKRVKVNGRGCWEWQGWRDRDGYGRTATSDGGVVTHRVIHRWMWELMNGEIPKGKMICHHCDNPTCVNPEHLYLGDGKSNKQDCIRRGRAVWLSGEDHWMHKNPSDVPRGSRRGQAKLTEAIVKDIRHRKHIRTCSVRSLIQQLANEYGVCKGTIAKVVWNKTWKHVTPQPPERAKDE